MPKSPAPLDDLDLDLMVQKIAADAAPLLASTLHSAGPLYPWDELVPGVVSRLLARLRDAAGPSPGDQRRVAGAARRCARDWVPLQELELTCQTLLTCVFRHLWDAVRPRACGDLLRVCNWTTTMLPDLLALVRRAYIEEMGRIGGRRADDLVVAALVEGGDAAGVAREAGLELPDSCVVVFLRQEASVAASRPREVPEEVRSLCPDGAICGAAPDHSGFVALLPVPEASQPEAEPAVRALASELVEACHRTSGDRFVAGLAVSGAAETAAPAVHEAVSMAELFVRLGESGRAGFLIDRVVGVLLGDRPDLRRRLVERLTEVRSQNHLWGTLRVLYRCDLDRGRTARALSIHRSTLDYRLGRVELLTGISPTSVQGIVLFSAGLAADALGP
ncbi:PucR family transcriptional regulator [Spirillospora sp. CA-294931]|uniref:PucR family transcriptional regulator n=1 Tax=Spirillospora sp. CA-294931 TaxID=3240042 RepID=UPI003D932B63